MTSKTMDEQLFDIDKILGGVNDYHIKGNTYPIKDDLQSWGWFWDGLNGFWRIDGVSENDPALTNFKDINKTWIEKIK